MIGQKLAMLIAVSCLLPKFVIAQAPETPSAENVASDDQGLDDEKLDQELTELRNELIKAFNTRDLELLLSHCHEDVIAIWPNGESAVGHDGVRKVIDELLGAEQPLIASYTTDPVVETRNVLADGKTVVSSGKFNDEYVLNRPKDQKVGLDSNWTATVVKFEDGWKIASFHLSANAFDNEVITLYSTMLQYWWGGLGLGAGLLIGIFLGFVFGRRRVRNQTSE